MEIKHSNKAQACSILNSVFTEGIPEEVTLGVPPVSTEEGAIQISGRRVPQAEDTATGKAGRQGGFCRCASERGAGICRRTDRRAGGELIGETDGHRNTLQTSDGVNLLKSNACLHFTTCSLSSGALV